MMDVILLKSVEKLGAEGAIVHVKPGFARNYLLPRGLAASASPSQRKVAEETQRRRAQKTQRAQAEAEVLKRKVESRPLTLTLNLGADGKAFGAITAHDVLEALAKEGFQLDKHAVQLEQPIKTLGTVEVSVRVHPDVTATVKVSVVKA